MNPVQFNPLIRGFLTGVSRFVKLVNLLHGKSKEKIREEASNTFHDIMKASVKGNPKPKNKESKKENDMYKDEFQITLEDGTVLDIQELKDINGKPKYLVNDPSGVYTPFTWSPYMPANEPVNFDQSQKTAFEQIKKKIKL